MSLLLPQLNLADNQLCGLDPWGHGTYTSEGIEAIAGALKVNGSLTKILVGGNELRDVGTTILCDALRESTVSKVEELGLSYNEIGPDGAKAIAALCAVRASLTSLDLSSNSLRAEGAKALAPGLAANGSLTKTLVGRNGLGDEGTTILCDALRESTVNKVEELDLRSNSIGPDGTKAIAALCAVRGSLTSLTLSYNSLKDEGVGAICEAIKSNKETKIAVLEIAGNSLSPAGAESVVAMAAVTGSLTELTLSDNRLKDEGISVICEAIQSNKQTKLATLNISDCSFGPEGAKSVAAMAAATGSHSW